MVRVCTTELRADNLPLFINHAIDLVVTSRNTTTLFTHSKFKVHYALSSKGPRLLLGELGLFFFQLLFDSNWYKRTCFSCILT